MSEPVVYITFYQILESYERATVISNPSLIFALYLLIITAIAKKNSFAQI